MKSLVIVLAVALSSASAFALSFDNDVPAAVTTQMKADLAFMASLSGKTVSALHQEIFGAMTGAGYQNFFESRVQSVGLSGCGSANAVACVIPFMDDTKIWVTQNYIKFSHPQIARLMVVYHEARHTESNHSNWPHETCPTPFLDEQGHDMHSIWTGASLAGQPACDATPYGSYGSSLILLKNVSKFCENCNEKVKQDAGIYADDQFKRITDAAAKSAIKKDLY